MQTLKHVFLAIALVALAASSTWAYDDMTPAHVSVSQPTAMDLATERVPAPGPAAAAAALNILYMPARLFVTVIGAELGGLTGLFTAGNVDAAEDIWGLTDGNAIITPEIIEGTEPMRFGRLQF